MKKIVNITLEEEVWNQAKSGAALLGITLIEWMTNAILQRVAMQGIEKREQKQKES